MHSVSWKHAGKRCGRLLAQDVGLTDLLFEAGGEIDVRKQQLSSYLFEACSNNPLSSNISLSWLWLQATVACTSFSNAVAKEAETLYMVRSCFAWKSQEYIVIHLNLNMQNNVWACVRGERNLHLQFGLKKIH